MVRLTRRMTLRGALATLASSLRMIARAGVASLSSQLLFSGKLRAKEPRAAVTAAKVEHAIRSGIAYLKSQQLDDGSWPNPKNHHQHTAGPTSLVVHALLVAGESTHSPVVTAALRYLEGLSPEEIDGNYSVALQTIVFAEVDPHRYAVKIAANVAWLEQNQIRAEDNNPGWPGSWAHASDKARRGDSSSTQFALLGLDAAAKAGIPVKPEVWALARSFLTKSQRWDGGWAYYPNVANSTCSASMTCAGISGLIITGQRLIHDQEHLEGDTVQNCGKAKVNVGIERGLAWVASRFSVTENPGSWLFRQWQHYYLYGMERVGRFAGLRYIGSHDWYREGAAELVATQNLLLGSWVGVAVERETILATSFALLFLATGRSPVLINKLKHGPGHDWNNDRDDIRNLVGLISADWKHLLTWQVVDPDTASVEDMLLAPIAYISGHEAPLFSSDAKRTLRAFIEQGGVLLAEACCSDPRFDQGFRALMEEIFPEEGYRLHPLDEGHLIWRSHHVLNPDIHPLWGIEHGCRTVVIYAPEDLSCSWNLMASQPSHPRIIKAQRLGQNIVDYVTGREIPADKLVAREVRDIKASPPKRGTLHIAKLRHAGDWNIAPLAIPHLASSLKTTLGMDVVINHKDLFATDPTLMHFPLVYLHGRVAFTFSKEELSSLRDHFDPGGGTLFADAACGSTTFDNAFRRFVSSLFPGNPLVPIPTNDALYTKQVGYDLSDVQFTKAAGGGRGFPHLEGVFLDGHWALIYSKYDIGCALERSVAMDCKGYSHESAIKIASNIVVYATLP